MTVALHLVFMGVSGCGKSAVGHAVAQRLGLLWGEGDDHHSPDSIAKMTGGTPLTDEDRAPWLAILHTWTAQAEAEGRGTALACSALRRSYRAVLRSGLPGTEFVHLAGDRDLLLGRMGSRTHFMPTALLDSQLATLEDLEPDESGITLDVARPLEELVDEVVERYADRVEGLSS